MEIVAHIIKYGFPAAGTSYRLYHGFQVGAGKFGVFMFRFIIDLNCNNIWIIFIGYPGIRIHMFKDLYQVPFLVRPGHSIVQAVHFTIYILKSGSGSIGFRVTILAKLQRGKDAFDSPFFQAVNQVVKCLEVPVGNDVANAVTYF